MFKKYPKKIVVMAKGTHSQPSRKLPTVIQGAVATYFDAKSMAVAEEIHFIETINSDMHWKKLVLRDISQEPNRKLGETFKNYYKRAYPLWLQIQKCVSDSKSPIAYVRSLFIKALLDDYEKFAEVLIEKIDINKKLEEKESGRSDKYTLIHWCAALGNENMMKLLIEHKANINVFTSACIDWEAGTLVDNIGNTPLILAAMNGKSKCLALLLTAKAEINHKTTAQGTTALHEAVKGNHSECVKLLLEAKADPSIRDHLQNLPIDLAKKHSSCEAMIKIEMISKGLTLPTQCNCLIQ